MQILLRRAASVGILAALLPIAAWLNAQETPPVAGDPAESSAGVSDLTRAYYHYMLARRYKELAGIYNRGDFVEKAIAEFKKAMEADPESLYLRVELAELYWRIGRLADAVREAEAVLKINPDQDDAHRLLAYIYWRNLGDARPDRVAKESLRKAIEHFEALVRLEPDDLDSHQALARLYWLNNQRDKAEEAYREVLERSPDSKAVLTQLMQLYFDQGEYEQAIALLGKADAGSMDAQLLSMLAYAYTQEQDFDSAVTTYEKALGLDGDNAEIRRAYAEALMGSGRVAAARRELEQILKTDPEDGPTVLRLAQLDRQEGRFEEARKGLERAKTLMPDSLEVAYQQVILEELLGNQEQAIQILEGLIRQSERPEGRYTPREANNHAIFLERLGLVYRAQQKYDKALEIFNRIAGLGKEQGPRGEGLTIETLRLARQPRKALEAAEVAIRKYPEDRSLRLLQSTLLGERGRVDEAIQGLRALLADQPSDREVYLSMAQIHSQAKRFPEAEEAARRALALSPKPGQQEYVFFVLGSVYERQKKYDLAEEQFQKVLAFNPLNAAAANYLGYMLADRGVRLEESVEYIQKALQLEPNNGAYLDSLGWAYFKMSRYDLAAPHLEKAASLVSGDPTIQEHLGHLYLRMGKRELAREAWERALKEWPDAVSSDFDAAQAARLQKQLEELKHRLAEEKRIGQR